MTGTYKASQPAKRIVICCDGTWCGPLAGTKTNTRILADSFASAGGTEINMYEQKEYGAFKCRIFYNKKTATHVMYMPGIGLGTNFEGYLMNGSLALEFGKCCTTAYKFIVEHFEPAEHDTRIYMFGHSRGAFTARAVAAMIHNCGILDIRKQQVETNLDALVEDVYNIYANNDSKYTPDSEASRKFRERLSHYSDCSTARLAKPPIEYLGLLDTVGALGVPKVNSGNGVAYENYNTDVSFDVLHVWQGLACHDRLTVFTPTHITRPQQQQQQQVQNNNSTAAAAAGDSTQPQLQAVQSFKEGSSSNSAANDVNGIDQGPGLIDTTGLINANSVDHSTLTALQSTTASAAPYVAATAADAKPTLKEVWLPGAHYDVGRQKFVLFRKAAGWESVVSYVNKHFNRMGLNIDFNTEQADLALLETLKGLYNTSADARAMLCHKNPVKTCKGKTVHKTRGEKVICDTEVLADEYKARTLPDPQIQGWLDAFADSAATLLLKVEPHVPEKWRAWLPLIARPTASQDAYDKIVCGITKNGLPATLFSMWLWPLHWVIDVVVKNAVCTSTPIVLADRHIPLYTEATFVSTAGISTDYVTGVNGVRFKSKSFNTYRVASGRDQDMDDDGN